TSFGNLLAGITGSIANLPVTPPGSPFMTFVVGGNNLNFFLSGVGPGVNNTSCVNTFDPNDPSCSVFAGSPFVLSPVPGEQLSAWLRMGTSQTRVVAALIGMERLPWTSPIRRP